MRVVGHSGNDLVDLREEGRVRGRGEGENGCCIVISADTLPKRHLMH